MIACGFLFQTTNASISNNMANDYKQGCQDFDLQCTVFPRILQFSTQSKNQSFESANQS